MCMHFILKLLMQLAMYDSLMIVCTFEGAFERNKVVVACAQTQNFLMVASRNRGGLLRHLVSGRSAPT